MTECVLCGHAQSDHHDGGCQSRRPLLGACHCRWVAPESLAADAGAAEHRARADWWDELARTSWDLALRARDDLDRWYPLMRLHRAARRADIEHRRYAESLEQLASVGTSPVSESAPDALVLESLEEPAMPFARRLELASIA